MPPKMSKASAAKEAKDKEKKMKAAGVEGGAGIEELHLQIETLTSEKVEEEELRNYMQLERDKIQTFWDITKARLEEKTDELATKDLEIESLQERHHVELKVYKQKVKHLLYVHQEDNATLRIEAEQQQKQTLDEAEMRVQELVTDKQNLQRELNEQEVAKGEMLHSLQVQHAKQITKLRQEMQATVQQMAEGHQHDMHEFREQQVLTYRQRVQVVEDRKAAHMQELQDHHSKECADMRAYYAGMTTSNLDTIQQLRKELADTMRKEAAASTSLAQVTAENRRLHEPLMQAQKTVENQRLALKDQEMERSTAAQNRGRLAAAQKQLKALQWEHEVLQQRYEQLEAEVVRLKAVCALRGPSDCEKQVNGMVQGNRMPLNELQACQ